MTCSGKLNHRGRLRNLADGGANEEVGARLTEGGWIKYILSRTTMGEACHRRRVLESWLAKGNNHTIAGRSRSAPHTRTTREAHRCRRRRRTHLGRRSVTILDNDKSSSPLAPSRRRGEEEKEGKAAVPVGTGMGSKRKCEPSIYTLGSGTVDQQGPALVGAFGLDPLLPIRFLSIRNL
ncbi:hypothetical protein M413DRAFT_278071 [Hebeloma cylindrosporum]|uniref:Uncharacterized protein n=1 Tax=Hebeloma cylindrosporum TaxID=76867 RepID=A0A0C2XHL7_HEBCY|nr:hypothetical protein M413DRAFT_380446 [Hebeloma cylindrosporum h7]KIM37358.1 hypothetical protein M413DRAFT_278071 [Hebeloma cylindrosporum h7]